MSWASSFKKGILGAKEVGLIQQGFNPLEYSRSKVYSKLKVRRYRRRRKKNAGSTRG